MIREATAADIPRLVELGSISLKNGPYAGRIKDIPAQSKRLAQFILEDRTRGVILVAESIDREVVGLLALSFFPHYFTSEKTAAELMWYVLPDKRLNFDALVLFRRAERVAREEGCTLLQFTAPTEAVATMYEKAGLKALEVGYYKDLTPEAASHPAQNS